MERGGGSGLMLSVTAPLFLFDLHQIKQETDKVQLTSLN